MPKVSPLRMLMGSTKSPKPPNAEEEEHKQSHVTGTPRKKGMSFATVYPHSENIPENLLTTPDKKLKAKFSWYQRQVKNLGADHDTQRTILKNPHQRTPRSAKVEPIQSHSTTASSSNAQEANATPKRSISRTLKYSATASLGSTNATPLRMQASSKATSQQHFELEEDSSFWLEHSVQVLIRIRPLNSQEIAAHGHDRCIRQDSAHSLTWIGNPDTRFTFDHVACESISQGRLFKVVGMPMVENSMRGYNSCIFAYGQTGSGKTYTMLGDINQKRSEDRGLTPRVFERLFESIHKEEEERRNEKLKFTCKCSFLEIHNEQITDLLEPSLTNLQVREDARRGVYVENLSEVEVDSVDDVLGLLLQGASNRKVAATNMNRESSRSHSVLTCVIESQWEQEAVKNRRFGRLNLVDLAGSERQKATGAESERLKEAVNINKSLSTLGLVIMVLVDVANGKQRHVPYRDSKLTYLLQDSLGGNSKTMVISTVSPAASCSMDTLSTLKFAQRAKFICNNAVVNEDSSRDVNMLREQINKLKEEVNRLRNQSGTCSSPSSLDERNSDTTLSHNEDKMGPIQSKAKTEINRMLSVEFQKLNQLRQSLEAELETKPFQNESYQKKLQDCHLENEKLRRQIAELQTALREPHKEREAKEQELRREIEILEHKHLKSMTDLECLLKESEESRILQATTIRNLETASNQYCAEIEELKAQLTEAKDVQEQMEKQQLFLISEFETVLEEHKKIADKLAKTEVRERKTKEHMRLVNWEAKKKKEVQDLERELETRASAEKLVGYVDEEENHILEEKLRKTRKELEEAHRLYKGKEELERKMEATRAEVEAETANALASMNHELVLSKEECEAANQRLTRLTEELEEAKLENRRLAGAYESLLQEKDMEVQQLVDFLAEGDQALVEAAKEMEDIIHKSFPKYLANNPVEVLQDKLQRALCIAKETERKVKALSEQQQDETREKCIETDQRQLREAEKKACAAFTVVRHLQEKHESEWKMEKEELLAELTEAKIETAAKSRETATVLQKFKESQHMLKEAEQLLNALVKANENAKTGLKDELRKSLSEPLDKAKSHMEIVKQEIGTLAIDVGDAMANTEKEVRETMGNIEHNMKEIMTFVFGFGDGLREEFSDLRNKMFEMTEEADILLGQMRRKNELVKGLEYDISMLQEAFSEAHEIKLELQEENNRMQEELETKTSEMEGAEVELLKLLKTLTTVESELRTLKETTAYLSTENNMQQKRIQELEIKNASLEDELDGKMQMIQSLDSELLEVSSLVEGKVLSSSQRGVEDLDTVLKERDELHAELCDVREKLQKSRNVIEELEHASEKSRKFAEEREVVSNEKDEEVKVLERSVQELESTITTMENQIGLVKRDSEMQRMMKQDLEMEIQRLRSELSRTRVSLETADYSGVCVDKIRLLRLEEEVESLREDCIMKDAQINSLRKHVSELMDTATKEAGAYRRKIKRLEASLETRCIPKTVGTQKDKASVKVKGSGSPFKCMGLGGISTEINEELSTNKRRVEELEAVASVREKEVFMLNAKLAQAESMTYDVVRDLLEVKQEISSFVHTRPSDEN